MSVATPYKSKHPSCGLNQAPLRTKCCLRAFLGTILGTPATYAGGIFENTHKHSHSKQRGMSVLKMDEKKSCSFTYSSIANKYWIMDFLPDKDMSGPVDVGIQWNIGYQPKFCWYQNCLCYTSFESLNCPQFNQYIYLTAREKPHCLAQTLCALVC